jgi:hypothetical protein
MAFYISQLESCIYCQHTRLVYKKCIMNSFLPIGIVESEEKCQDGHSHHAFITQRGTDIMMKKGNVFTFDEKEIL